jgi:hypothetical protein
MLGLVPARITNPVSKVPADPVTHRCALLAWKATS